MPSASSRVPTGSGAPPIALAGRKIRVPAITSAMPNGMLIKNTACQLNASTSSPPRLGPTAAAAAPAALSSEIDMTRRSAGVSSRSTDSDAGTMTAAPTPWIALAAMSSGSVGESAHSSEATVNSTMPPSRIRLRPNVSARRPVGASNAANSTA